MRREQEIFHYFYLIGGHQRDFERHFGSVLAQVSTSQLNNIKLHKLSIKIKESKYEDDATHATLFFYFFFNHRQFFFLETRWHFTFMI